MGHTNVLFLGDSIPIGNSSRLASRSRVRITDSAVGIANFAVAGATTSQVLWQVRAGQVAAVTPDVVVMLIGANNIGMANRRKTRPRA